MSAQCAECCNDLDIDEMEDGMCEACLLDEVNCSNCGREVDECELDGNGDCDECWGEDGPA